MKTIEQQRMDKLYPFCKEKNKDYPLKGGLIVKEVFDDEVWKIEYDTEMILEKSKEKGINITKEHLMDLLVITTFNIIEINHYFLDYKTHTQHYEKK